MSEVPLWALSPSPFTIAIYFLMAYWASRKLLDRTDYKRFKRVTAFLDAGFILGIIVLVSDCVWILTCLIRFGSYYPGSIKQLIICLGRNLAGIIFCFLLTYDLFSYEKIRITKTTIILLHLNFLFLFVWFLLSPSPAYTDWTFAFKNGYSLTVCLTSFLISHLIGRLLIFLIYESIFQD